MIRRGYAIEAGAAAPEHVGTVTKYSSDVNPGFVSGSALDISSIDIQAGDIGIIAFSSSGSTDGIWSWGGDIDFEQLVNSTYNTFYGGVSYVGFATLDGTETEIFTSGVTATAWDDLSIVFSVFRNVSFVNDICMNYGNSGTLTPPDLPVTEGSMVVIAGMLDDDAVVLTAPTDYTLAGASQGGGSSPASSCAIAYRSDHSTGTENPGSFGGTFYNDEWVGVTLELTATDTRPYKLMDTKVVTVTDATAFDAAGDFDISALDFQSGDLAFIDICSDEGGITSYSWGGDVDFAELSNSSGTNPQHYQGWAILDGTETDIHLTSGFTTQLQGGIISLGIWRGPAYPAEKTSVAGGTTGFPSVGQPTPTAGDMRIACAHIDDDVVTLPATEGHQQLATQGNVNTGTYSCSSAMSWQTYNTDSFAHSNRFPDGDDFHSSIAFRFTDTKPSAHSVSVIGTNSGTFTDAGLINTYAEGIALPAGISTGDIMVVQVSSSGDADSDFFIRCAGLSGSQDMTVLTRSSSSTFVAGTFWLELNTTTLGSSPRIYIVNGGSNIDNNSICLAVFDGSTLSGVRGEANTQYLASGMPQSLSSVDWVQRGSLIIQAGSSDGAAVAHTAPTGYTQAVAVNNSASSSCSINYKTDFETGILTEGNDYGGGGSSQNLSVMMEFLSS